MPTSTNGQNPDANQDDIPDGKIPPHLSDSGNTQTSRRALSVCIVILLCVIAGLSAIFVYQKRQVDAFRNEGVQLRQQLADSLSDVSLLRQQLDTAHTQGEQLHQQVEGLSQQLDAAHTEGEQLRQQVEDLITANRSSGLQLFPLTAQMEDAFRNGNYEQATRLAENLLFAYPSDAPSYQILLTAYESAVDGRFKSDQLLDGVRLLSWMTVIQDRQAMVIKSEESMEAYLSSLERQRRLMSSASAIAARNAEALKQKIHTLDEDWNSADFDNMTSEAAALVLVGAMLDDPQITEQATTFIEAIELLNLPAPSEQATPEEMLDYLWELRSRQDREEPTDQAVKAIIAPRITIVFDELADELDSLAQSPESIAWLWDRLDELRSLTADSTESFRSAVGLIEESLLREAKSETTKAIADLRAGGVSEPDLVGHVSGLVRKFERLGEATIIETFARDIEQARAARHDANIAGQILEIRNRLKSANIDFDALLAELALLPQPNTTHTMSELIKLTQEVQRAVAQKDKRDSEAKVRAYNRWALSKLNRLMKVMDQAPKWKRDDTRIGAAKPLSSINEAFLTRAMRDRYAEVYAESMKGLNEEQKLTVYEHWVSAVQKDLENVP